MKRGCHIKVTASCRIKIDIQVRIYESDELKKDLHGAVTGTLRDLDDTCVTAVAVNILRRDLSEHLLGHVNLLCPFLTAFAFLRDFRNRIEDLVHLSSRMEPGRKVFFDLRR